MPGITRLALTGMAVVLPLAVLGAAPVIEERGTAAAPPAEANGAALEPAAAAPPPPPRGEALGELFYQLQVLQQEVLELRGKVEEQAHRIDRMASEQRQRYLDIDRRLSGLAGGQASPAKTPENLPADGGESPVTGAPPSEQDAYNAAFALTRQRNFEAAITAFQQLLQDYPNGTYAPNAYYWLGELYLALPEPQLERARASFAQVVNAFPGHPKVPDALYKLGVVYDRLGETDRAKEYLERVQRDFPASSAAKLAATYAAAL